MFKFAIGFIVTGIMMLFSSNNVAAQRGSAHDFTFTSLMDDTPLPLSQFKGKVLLVVNTASQCGFTKQYEGLEALYQQYKDKGFVVIGVPSNDFGQQEPGTSGEIAKFCKINYGVTFPMTAKEIVTGKSAHPFYQWAAETLGFGSTPKWNFHKYLVGKNGQLIDFYLPTTTPESEKIRKAIDAALGE